MKTLEKRLRELRTSGRRALVPYLMAGLDDDWLDHLRAAAHAGADAIEVGLPFSDPMIDGPIIQEAATRSLARGTTIHTIVADLLRLDLDVPLVAMTYANVLAHAGFRRSAQLLTEAGILGIIVPDLPLEEMVAWRNETHGLDLASVLLVAPSTPRERCAAIAAMTQGFCYASARMAVTGSARSDSHAHDVVTTVRATSDVPVYVGIGVSEPAQAREVSDFADGVIVGSALVQRVLNGEGPRGVETFVSSFREAMH